MRLFGFLCIPEFYLVAIIYSQFYESSSPGTQAYDKGIDVRVTQSMSKYL